MKYAVLRQYGPVGVTVQHAMIQGAAYPSSAMQPADLGTRMVWHWRSRGRGSETRLLTYLIGKLRGGPGDAEIDIVRCLLLW